MPRNVAPANISSAKDLVQYNVVDAEPVEANAAPGYIERYIHSEIYRRFPGVRSIIHSHASAVLPYSISDLGVPLKACMHMAGFLGMVKPVQDLNSGSFNNEMTGAETPVFDVAKYYKSDATRDLLIRNRHLGESLAKHFHAEDADVSDTETFELDHSVVLMRGHGYTVAAQGIEECIFRAIYTRDNAAVQTASLSLMAAAYNLSYGPRVDVDYLHQDELSAAGNIARNGWARAWGLWVREVEAISLYMHDR